MSAAEVERGVGDCPDRPEGFGHIWAGTKLENGGGDTNPCRFCGTSGRAFFKVATASVWARAAAVHAPMESGTGNLHKAHPKGLTPAQLERAAEIVADKKRRDAVMVADGTARPGQVAGAPKGARS